MINGEEMVVSTLRDISSRKKTENELKRSQQRLTEVQDLAGIGTESMSMVVRLRSDIRLVHPVPVS